MSALYNGSEVSHLGGGVRQAMYAARHMTCLQIQATRVLPRPKRELSIHQVTGPFDNFVRANGGNGVVAVLEVEAEGEVGTVLEEDIADGAVDVVDGRSLCKH